MRATSILAVSTYDEARLHQPDGDGMIEKGIGERDERYDKPIFSLAL